MPDILEAGVTVGASLIAWLQNGDSVSPKASWRAEDEKPAPPFESGRQQCPGDMKAKLKLKTVAAQPVMLLAGSPGFHPAVFF